MTKNHTLLPHQLHHHHRNTSVAGTQSLIYGKIKANSSPRRRKSFHSRSVAKRTRMRRIYDTMRRKCEKLFKKAYVLYICNGLKWEKSIADFVKWSFEYCMWVKMSLFYEKAADGFQEEGFGKQPLNSLQLLEMLPDKFERGDFVAVCKKTTLRTPARNLLYRMLKAGLLIKVDEETFGKV